MKVKTQHIFFLIFSAALAAGCVKEDIETRIVPGSDSIVFRLETPGTATRADAGSTAASEGVEADIEDLDIFIFNREDPQECVYYHHFTTGDRLLDNRTATVVLDRKKKEFTEGARYRIYMLANCNKEARAKFEDFESSRRTLDELRVLTQTTEDIHLTGGTDQTQTFLMDGIARDTNENPPRTSAVLNDGSNDNTYLGAVLSRAAAKIKVNITAKEGSGLSFPLPADLPTGAAYSYNFVNFRQDTRLLAEGGRATGATLETKENLQMMYDSEYEPASLSLVTYSYSHEWSTASVAENETCIIVNVPVTYTDANGATQTATDNWYKIPVGKVGDDGSRSLSRNTLYEIDAQIGTLGSKERTEPEEILDLKYSVYEGTDHKWTEVEVEVGTGSEVAQYLEVNHGADEATKLVLNNVTDDSSSLIFASSSDVTVEIVSITYKDKNGLTQTPYTLNSLTETKEGYYEKKEDDGPEEWFPYVSISTNDNLKGNIVLHSKIPDNLCLMRTIKLRITNKDGYKKEILIEQYPLNYITFVEGYYSYRVDLCSDDTSEQPDITTYLHRGQERYYGATLSFDDDGHEWTNQAITRNNNDLKTNGFISKVYYNQGIYRYYWDNNNTLQRTNNNITTLTNPNMYHLRITKTDEDYKLATPMRDKNDYTESSEVNNNLVSPSFMLASQLGAFSNTAISSIDEKGRLAAAEHCSKYVETYKDESGNVYRYADWRLPTKKELMIIADFQNTATEAMTTVLTGKNYWCAMGLCNISTGKILSQTDDNENSRAIRCIRDAYETEPTPEPAYLLK